MQDEVKVSQADIEAVRHFYNNSSANLTGQELVELEQAFARHRHQAERDTLARMEWRDIESAPRDGSWFTAYWPVQTFEDRVQTTRWLHDDCRFVDASDFMDHIQPIAWMPLPPAPEAA